MPSARDDCHGAGAAAEAPATPNQCRADHGGEQGMEGMQGKMMGVYLYIYNIYIYIYDMYNNMYNMSNNMYLICILICI